MSGFSYKLSVVKKLKPYSKVYLYKDKWTSYFAGEVVPQQTNTDEWRKSVSFLQSTGSHENVLKIFATYCTFTEKPILLMMELCDGNLEEYIHNRRIHPLTQTCSNKQSTPQIHARQYFQSNRVNLPFTLDLINHTAQGLKFLHDNDIVHGDIKASKVLLRFTSQNKTVVKLGGFRRSKKWQSTHYFLNNWKSNDISDLGRLIYEAVTEGKCIPYMDGERLRFFTSGQCVPAEVLPNYVEEEMSCLSGSKEQTITTVDLIKGMVNQDPTKRLTVDEVLYHPAFYTQKRKLEFLLKIHESLKRFGISPHNSLKPKIDAAVKSYTFNPEIMFSERPYLLGSKAQNPSKSNSKKKNIGNWRLYYADSIGNVVTLLKALRDKVAHARDSDGNVPERFKEDFGVTYDSYDPAKFVKVFVTEHYPYLLVDLYNIYKGNEYGCAVDFYP